MINFKLPCLSKKFAYDTKFLPYIAMMYGNLLYAKRRLLHGIGGTYRIGYRVGY